MPLCFLGEESMKLYIWEYGHQSSTQEIPVIPGETMLIGVMQAPEKILGSHMSSQWPKSLTF